MWRNDIVGTEDFEIFIIIWIIITYYEHLNAVNAFFYQQG